MRIDFDITGPGCAEYLVQIVYDGESWDSFVYEQNDSIPLEELDGMLGMWYVPRGVYDREAEDAAEDACRLIQRMFKCAVEASGGDYDALPCWSSHSTADVPPLWFPFFHGRAECSAVDRLMEMA